MSDEHHYPPGWFQEVTYDGGPWQKVDNDMSAWRFCPPCGLPLLPPEYMQDWPLCSGCRHEIGACPCGCDVEHAQPTAIATLTPPQP